MSRRWLAPIAATLPLLLALALAVTAFGARSDARRALHNAERLHRARLDVARAEKELSGSDLDDANESAREANDIALSVGGVTRQIADQLERVQATIEAITETARLGANNTLFAREQTEVASELLGAIRGYQAQADRLSHATNRSLQRVLSALRETNRQFPGGP